MVAHSRVLPVSPRHIYITEELSVVEVDTHQQVVNLLPQQTGAVPVTDSGQTAGPDVVGVEALGISDEAQTSGGLALGWDTQSTSDQGSYLAYEETLQDAVGVSGTPTSGGSRSLGLSDRVGVDESWSMVFSPAPVQRSTEKIRWHVRDLPYAIAVSDRLRAVVRQSHVVSTVAYIRGSALDGQTWGVVSGEITIDGDADTRRRAHGVLVPPPGMPFPREALEKIGVHNTTLVLVRRYDLGDGLVEGVLLGTFRVEEITSTLSGVSAEFEAYSVEMLVGELPLLTPYPAKQDGVVLTYRQLITDLITSPFSQFVVDFDDRLSSTMTPREDAVWEGNRWDAIREMAEALGGVCYAARDGVTFVVAPYIRSLSIRERLDTGPDGILISETTQFSRKDMANGVLLRVEPPEGDVTSFTAFVVDNDPDSLTYWGDLDGPPGPFGRKVYEDRNDTITTAEAAIAAAQELLAQRTGVTRAIDFHSVIIPWLEPGDIVLVAVDSLGWVSEEQHVIDMVRIPLGTSGEMTGSTRVLSEVTT